MKHTGLRKVVYAKYNGNTYVDTAAYFHCFTNEYVSHYGVGYAKGVAILETEQGDVIRIDADRIIRFKS